MEFANIISESYKKRVYAMELDIMNLMYMIITVRQPTASAT